MSLRSQLPLFPQAPDQYNGRFGSDLVAALNRLMVVMANPGVGRNTQLTLTHLQTDDSGLELGGLFQVDGVLRVAIINRPYARGLSARGRVGTVAVRL